MTNIFRSLEFEHSRNSKGVGVEGEMKQSKQQSGKTNAASLESLERLDFDSRFFDSTMAHYVGDEIVERGQRMQANENFQRNINQSFNAPDVVADRLLSRIMLEPQIKKDFEVATKKGINFVENPCEELKAFIDSAVDIPDFIDRKKVEAGGKVFRSKLDLPGLAMFAIPITIYQQGFVQGITTSLLFSNKPDQKQSIEKTMSAKAAGRKGSMRLLETFKWFNKVAEPGSGEVFSEAFYENCRIRLVHAYVRFAINSNKTSWNYEPNVGWNEEILGAPLSTGDGSIVVSTIVVTLFAMKRHLNKNISSEELDALNHWSNYVSYLQGVPQELLFEDVEDTLAYFAAFMMSINVNAYYDEMAIFIKKLQEMRFEKIVARNSKSVQIFLNGLTKATLEDKFNQRVRTHYNIESAPLWAKSTLFATKTLLSTVNTVSKYIPKLNSTLDMQAEKLWSELIPQIEEAVSRQYGSVIGQGIKR